MGSFRRPKDGRLSWLPHIGSLRLPRKQQRMRIGIGIVVDNPEQVADDAGNDEGSVRVPAHQEAGDGCIELFNESGHGCSCMEQVKPRARRAWRLVAAVGRAWQRGEG